MEKSVHEATEALFAGRYRLVHRIAAGGMGEIFLAVQDGPRGFQKLVALKRLLSDVAQDMEWVQHFLDEAQLTSRLTHRNIAQVFDFGEDVAGYFVAMEFVQGANLHLLLNRLEGRGRKLAPALALDIAAQVAEALDYAWEARAPDGTPLRVVHRDISPQNVMVSISGDVKLIDFGVAKSNLQLYATVGKATKGKLAYMSPEQNRGENLDTRSDQFSLGIVLAQMLSGVHPFARSDLLEMVSAVRTAPPELPSTRDPSLAVLDSTLERMLAKAPGERFQSCREVAEALQSLRLRMPQAPVRLGALVTECFGAELDALVSNEKVKTPRSPSSDLAGDTRVFRPLEPPAFGATLAQASERSATLVPSRVEHATSHAPPGIHRRPRRRAVFLAAGAFLAASAATIGTILATRLPHTPAPSSSSSVAIVQQSAKPVNVHERLEARLSGSNPEAKARLEPDQPAEGRSSSGPLVRGLEPDQPAEGRSTSGPLVRGLEPDRSAEGRSTSGPLVRGPAAEADAEMLAAAPEPAAAPVEPAPRAAAPQSISGSQTRDSRRTGRKASAAALDPARPPSSRAPALRAHATLPSGEVNFNLDPRRGVLKLVKRSGMAVYLDYSADEAGLQAQLRCEPWAILSIDGVSIGKTPVALPSLLNHSLRLELRRPGVPPLEIILGVER